MSLAMEVRSLHRLAWGHHKNDASLRLLRCQGQGKLGSSRIDYLDPPPSGRSSQYDRNLRPKAVFIESSVSNALEKPACHIARVPHAPPVPYPAMQQP